MKPVSYIVMGVSGSGKTSVGKLLAQKLKLPFYDADDFHPTSNIKKMREGNPLTDEDRMPWLEILQREISTWEHGGVLACSALKESYREVLQSKNNIKWIYLKGNAKLISERMAQRDHFMKPEMLDSQFEALEEPNYGIHLDITNPLDSLVSEILSNLIPMNLSNIGIIGMGVMGKSLAKNALSKGLSVSVYNRLTPEEAGIIPDLISEVNSPKLNGFTSLEPFISSLAEPAIVLMMIPAGEPIDACIETLIPLLHKGAILIDGGNSFYKDTQRREQSLKLHGIEYLGMGVSGGEQGALHGPSFMVGGSFEAYTKVKELLDPISAQDPFGYKCLGYMGADGAGHYVKTIHNGIEYAEMQLLAEVYALLKPSLNNEEIAEVFKEWNEHGLGSFLLETTIEILLKKEDNQYLLDFVLDQASSKGTGTWSSISALEMGVPANLLIEAVIARSISNLNPLRTKLSKSLDTVSYASTIDTEMLKEAYQFARILNHQQGLSLIAATSEKENWNIDLSEVLRVWTNGCILRSELVVWLIPLMKEQNNLLTHPEIFTILKQSEVSVVEIIHQGMEQRTPLPCFSSALNYWYGITTKDSSASLIQAQRDAFGAHGYQRTDKGQGEWFTSQWNSNG